MKRTNILLVAAMALFTLSSCGSKSAKAAEKRRGRVGKVRLSVHSDRNVMYYRAALAVTVQSDFIPGVAVILFGSKTGGMNSLACVTEKVFQRVDIAGKCNMRSVYINAVFCDIDNKSVCVESRLFPE